MRTAINDDPDEQPPRRPQATLSKTPSWIMLGFVLGAAFMAWLPPLRKPPAVMPTGPVRPALRPADPPAPARAPQLTTIEAVFAEWGRFAVWQDDVTEVALWDPASEQYNDFYEVRRIDGSLYFRTLPRLTRPIIRRGAPLPGSPLQYTAPEELYREWLNRTGGAGWPAVPMEHKSRPPSPPPPPSSPPPPSYRAPTTKHVRPPLVGEEVEQPSVGRKALPPPIENQTPHAPLPKMAPESR